MHEIPACAAPGNAQLKSAGINGKRIVVSPAPGVHGCCTVLIGILVIAVQRFYRIEGHPAYFCEEKALYGGHPCLLAYLRCILHVYIMYTMCILMYSLKVPAPLPGRDWYDCRILLTG